MRVTPGVRTIVKTDLAALRIIHYPDPHLREACAPVTDFDGDLAALVARMAELMVQGKGVGLAAPQVGINRRLFVMSPTGKREDLCVLVNPVIHEPTGTLEAEEGCLSLPGIDVQVRRAQRIQVAAQDTDGKAFALELEDLSARIVQHETDHLNGVMIIDRMGPTDRIATRKTLRALEDNFRSRTASRSRAARGAPTT
jgi:peptide deformylase